MPTDAKYSSVDLPQYYNKHTSHQSITREAAQTGQWHLHRRTSVRIESEPNTQYLDERSDTFSTISSLAPKDRRVLRGFRLRLGNVPNGPSGDRSSTAHETQISLQSSELGMTVVIEASRPLGKESSSRRDMKGLDQAASMSRWIGNAKPSEPWGKLLKDPELWDPSGDTIIYYGYQRPEPSFRLSSSIIEDTKSEVLLHMLQGGYHANPLILPQGKGSPSPSPKHRLKIPGFGRRSDTSGERPAKSKLNGEAPIHYELYFPAPEEAPRMEVLRHHITTRNLFAFLLNKPLVGLTFYQALVDLHERIKSLMSKGLHCAQAINDYLIRNAFHNVENDPTAAAGLLAWSEDPEVVWSEGWQQGIFVCSSLYNKVHHLQAFRDVSPKSREVVKEVASRIVAKQVLDSGVELDRLSLGSKRSK